MDSAELGDRVVAVVEEHPLVQLLRAVEADRGIDRMVAAHVEVADELVEEQAPQRLVAAAVPGEQRALDDFGQIDQREHRTVEVGEVPAQHIGFVRGEGLGDVHSHEDHSRRAEQRALGISPTGADLGAIPIGSGVHDGRIGRRRSTSTPVARADPATVD